MARVTDTSIVRDYCLANGGSVFDLNYLSANLFRDIPHVNLRKIVKLHVCAIVVFFAKFPKVSIL